MRKVVEQARSDLDSGVVDKELLQRLYRDYNGAVEELALFIDRSEKLFPKFNCGVATVYLRHLLGRGEIVQGKYRDHNHTFLVLDEKTMVDITSDQYGGSKVYIGPIKAPWSR